MMSRTKRSTLGAVALAGLLVAGVGSGSAAQGLSPRAASTVSTRAVPQPGPATSLGRSNTVSGAAAAAASQYIVRFKNEAGLNSTVFDELRAGTALSDVWNHAIDGFVAALTSADLQRLANDPDVASIAPDRVIKTSVDQISPPWGLDRIDQRTLPLNGGYSYATSGAGVTAYVLDTGINQAHTEFSGKILRSAFVDFTALPPTTAPETANVEDCNGHGTHVAGTIGGTTFGVAKNVSIVPIKVVRCNGSATDSDIISGLDFVLADHLAFPGPAVANLSLGGTISPSLDIAIANVIASGVTVVVAAGNDNADACSYSPGHLAAVITVAASDINDKAATFTNHGSCVDLFAPGVKILSAYIGGPDASAVLNGTSMASPHVAGVVARMLELTPAATPAEIATALDAAATLNVLNVSVGDPNKLVYRSPPIVPSPPFLATVPGAPRALTAKPLNGSATLSWLAPMSDGRSAITGYITSCAAAGQTTVTDTSAVTPWTVVGLTNGAVYSCTVAATNALGVSPLSNAELVTPRTTPDTVDAPTATPASRKATLAWTPPPNNGGAPIKGYVVSCSDGITVRSKKAPATATTVNVSGLTNGTQYACNIAARNIAGVGSASGSATVTPRTIPGKPQISAVIPGAASATITFTSPVSDGGSTITSYTATCTSTALGATTPVSSSGGTSPMLVPGLTPAKHYSCGVLATNAAGSSHPTTPKSVTPTS